MPSMYSPSRTASARCTWGSPTTTSMSRPERCCSARRVTVTISTLSPGWSRRSRATAGAAM